MCERIDSIRAVRIAAHELANACSAVTGGTEMAISLPTVHVLAEKVAEEKQERGREYEH